MRPRFGLITFAFRSTRGRQPADSCGLVGNYNCSTYISCFSCHSLYAREMAFSSMAAAPLPPIQALLQSSPTLAPSASESTAKAEAALRILTQTPSFILSIRHPTHVAARKTLRVATASASAATTRTMTAAANAAGSAAVQLQLHNDPGLWRCYSSAGTSDSNDRDVPRVGMQETVAGVSRTWSRTAVPCLSRTVSVPYKHLQCPTSCVLHEPH